MYIGKYRITLMIAAATIMCGYRYRLYYVTLSGRFDCSCYVTHTHFVVYLANHIPYIDRTVIDLIQDLCIHNLLYN